jgi:hypothetical protein
LVTLDPLPVWIAVAGIATLLAHAALAKAADRPLLEQQLAAYGVPAALQAPATVALPAAEALAALLLLTPWRSAGAALAAALLLAYGAAMAWQRLHGRSPDCGCGGEPMPVSWPLVARNAALALVALAAGAPTTGRPMTLSDFAVVAVALVIGTLLYAALHQVLRLTGGAPARTPFRRS